MTTALVSIHDVMPETLPQTAEMLRRLARSGVKRTTLLVVPGRSWSAGDLETLRYWARLGHCLAGHGWHHRLAHHRGLYSRVHSRLLSRTAAEHLALDAPGVLHLMHRCHHWFRASGLPIPELYVPPAWALGPLSRRDLSRQPFRMLETLAGLRDATTGHFLPLPLVGFEADAAWRAAALRASNGTLRRLGGHRPLRVAIHPHDAQLRLADDLDRLIGTITAALDYQDLEVSERPHAGRTAS